MTSPSVLGVLDIPAEKEALAGARRWLREVVATDYAPIGDDVVLLGCELATNAIRYSESVKLTIVVWAMDSAIRVEVIDAGSDINVPRMVDTDPSSERGRGLQMVNDLTQGRWGWYTDDGGRVVWFEKPYELG
jgi:anti-sigma regulatory factor (Ser/Thr protein kinase)